MSRELTAYVLLAVLILGVGFAIFLTWRNSNAQRYRRASQRRVPVRGRQSRR